MLKDEFVEAGLGTQEAEALAIAIADGADPRTLWRSLCDSLLSPSQPFALHQAIHAAVFANWEVEIKGPAPTWISSQETTAGTNLASLMGDEDYAALHRKSIENPVWYWSVLFERLGIHASTGPQAVLDLSESAEHARWFPGMELNIGLSCFAGRDPNGTALIWAGQDGVLHRMSRRELESECHRVAWALKASGFEPGDAVAVDMPMTQESVVIYLGLVLAGCVVVSIADSFAPDEIATRMEIAEAKGIFTQDVILRGEKTLPLYERVVDADCPKAIVLPAGPDLVVELREGDLSWKSFLDGSQEGPFPVPVSPAESLTNILFSSGTTGTPKAIGWTHLTPIKAAADGWAHHDIQEGQVVAWPTNLGWMMGPWLIYASLLNGAAIALYEGIPSGRSFCRFVQDARVTMLGVVPSLVRAWKASQATKGLDWTQIRCFSSTGEASNPEEMHWLMSRAGYKPVIEYCGGTEIGGGYICGTRVQDQVAATFSTPALGASFVLLDEEGLACSNGELALVPPMLGSSQRLLNRDHHKVYYEGMPVGPKGEQLRRHGDQMEELPGGFFRALGRVDDTMNLGGIKVSSAELERACTMDGLKECAAIAVPRAGGGPSQLVVYAVLEDGVHLAEEKLAEQMQKQLRETLNPLFKVHAVRCIPSLPRTASNKVMRRVLRAQFRHG